MNKLVGAIEQASFTRNKITTLPVIIRRCFLSNYPNKRVSFFRSSEIVFIRIIQGAMYARVNNKELYLNEGNVFFIPLQESVDLYSKDDNDCTFGMIYADIAIFETISHLGEQPFKNPFGNIPYIHFTSDSPGINELVHTLDRIHAVQLNRAAGFECEILSHLFMIAAKFFTFPEASAKPEQVHSSCGVTDIQIQKEMLSFIHTHFSERILLDDIAASGKICRSKCCSIFRKHIKQSPIEYLNDYRLTIAQDYLLDHSLSIAAIAANCGFAHQSYFTKLYTKKYGYTPNEFRKGKQSKEAEKDLHIYS